jgi:hypothetical protein
VKDHLVLWTALLLCGFQVGAAAQEKPWLTDKQARDSAAAAVHSEYPEPCYSTYRDERLESFVLSVRKSPIVGNQLNNSVFLYRVATDVCDYVVEEGGKPVLHTQATMDCCEYGMVAVDRVTARTYWFAGNRKRADIFKEFAHDEELCPDSSKPTLFTALYRELVWGDYNGKEIQSLGQLRDLVQTNFQSAYSPYERDTKWQRKFDAWWRQFRSQAPQLKLETTYEPATDGTMVRGYGFSGFELTIPRSDPPPKGTPKLFQWALLVKHDGTIEEHPSKVIYSSR